MGGKRMLNDGDDGSHVIITNGGINFHFADSRREVVRTLETE